jgi:hypothetical protein
MFKEKFGKLLGWRCCHSNNECKGAEVMRPLATPVIGGMVTLVSSCRAGERELRNTKKSA